MDTVKNFKVWNQSIPTPRQVICKEPGNSLPESCDSSLSPLLADDKYGYLVKEAKNCISPYTDSSPEST